MQNNNSYLAPVQQTPEIEQLSEKIRVNTPKLPSLNNPFNTQNSTPSFDELINKGVDTRKKTIDYSTPFLNVYKPLSSGDYVSMYEKYIPNIDNQERLAQEQTSWDKLSNGVLKFGTKTGNAVLGGTVGMVYGIGSAINNGQGSAIYDNDFSNWLNDLDVKMNYQLPNYYSKQEQEKGLGGQMLTTNFWADKFLGGLAFTAGAIVSEGIWAWATGGTSLASSGARLGTKIGRALRWGAEGAEDTAQVLNGMSKYKSFLQTVPGRMYKSGEIPKGLAIGLAKTAEVGNLVRFATTSAGYEASVEALQFRKEAEEKYLNSFEELNGRQPTAEERAEFNKNLESSANSVFLTNMAIVGSSNLVTMGHIFDIKSPFKTGISEFLEKKAFGIGIDKTTGEILKQSTKQKVAKGFFDYVAKPSLAEGLFEEGLQGVTQKTANKWMEHTYNPSISNENLDLTGMIYDSAAEQYGSKEGWVENGLGMIIGIVGGARNSYVGNQQTQKELEYKQAVGKTFDQKTIQGELIIPQRLQAMNRMVGFTQEAQEEAKKGNIVKSQLAQNDVLLSFINAKQSLGASTKDIVKEVSDSLEAISPRQWAEAGIENSEDYKKQTLEEFERVAKSYEKNKTYWQYMIGKKLVGEQNLPEGVLEQTFGTKLSPNQVIIDSLTWSSVRGENAAKFMDDMQSVLTNELGIENGKTLKTISKLLGTKGNLTRTLNSNRALFNSLSAERDNLVKEIEKLNNAPKETEGQDSQKRALASLSSQLLETNSKITEINTRIEDIASQLNSAQQNLRTIEGTDLSGNLADSYISGQDLLNLDKNVEKFKSTLEYVKSTDQQRGQYLEDMMNEYQQAQEIFMLHQASSKMATEAKLENINTWVGGKFLKKNKSMDLDAMEWFTEVANKYKDSKAEAYNKFKEETSTEEEQVAENPVNEVKAKSREQEIQDEIVALEQERDNTGILVSDIEAKKDDIEKRKKESLLKLQSLELGDTFAPKGTVSEKLNEIAKFFITNFGWKFEGDRENVAYVSKENNRVEFDIDGLEVNLEEGQTFRLMGGAAYPTFTPQEVIEAKYNAELKALESTSVEDKKANIEKRIQEVKSKLGHSENVKRFEELIKLLELAKSNLSREQIDILLKGLNINSVAVVGGTTDVNRNSVERGDMDTAWVENPSNLKGVELQEFTIALSNLFKWIQSDNNTRQQPEVAEENGESSISPNNLNGKTNSTPIFIDDIVKSILSGEYITSTKENTKINKKIEKLQQELNALRNTPQENLIEDYKKKIEKLLNGTYEFLGRDVGSSYLDVLDKKPTTEEIEKYRELKKEGQEDTPEFKALERKLQNWKLLDTMVDNEYMSIAEMVDIINQHETEVSKEETKTELTEQDVEDTWDGVSDFYDDSLLQNTTASVTAKREANGDIRFSHLKLSNIYNRLGGVATADGKEVTAEELDGLKPKKDKKIAIVIDGLNMTLDSSGRIAMRYEDYIANRQRLNMFVLNPNATNWTYKSVSEWNGEETVKIESDFVEDINANDLYELKAGEQVSFVLYNEDGYNDQMHKELSKEEFKKVIKIMVVKDGKNLSVVKASQETSNENLLDLREKAYKAYINKTSKTLGTTTVSQVYLGTPEVKMDEKGNTVNISISSEATDRVVKATGFIQNGQITTNITFPEGTVNTSFISKISEKNKEQKVPFVVIQRGIHLLAYPVTMVKSQDSKLSDLEIAFQEPTVQKQVIAVNNLIDKFNIKTDKVFPENIEQKQEDLRKAFDENQTFTTMEEFSSDSYKLENLKNDVLINIDLDNIEKAISDAKVRVSLDNADFKLIVSLDTKNLSKTDIEQQLSDIAIELNEDYTQNADTKYLYSKGKEVGNIIEGVTYTDTFDDTPPTEAKSQLDKIRNMNILRKALSDKLPSDLKAIITPEKLKTIDDLFKAYDRIQKQTTVDKSQAENGEEKICS